ncbi:MAG: alpha/beta hydrolase [Chloroflexi bacterium]|nr:alpha/beta hydrolase [Chloroflexota bacterium]
MTSYLLVHGGSQGEWCWQRLVPLLKQSRKVSGVAAPDLPGHGARAGEPHEGITLDDYVNCVVDEAERREMLDIVLVGHSLGGITVIAAAPRLAARLKRVVFLGGMVPDEGASAAQMLAKRWQKGPLEAERIAAAGQRQVFCSDMDDATARWFLSQITPEPRKPLETPIHVSTLPRGVPISYIVQTKDMSLSPEFQRYLLKNLNKPEVLELASGRNGMFSVPEQLAKLLLRWS